MMNRVIIGMVCVGWAGLSGCVSSSDRGRVTPISMSDLVQKLGCELVDLSRSNPDFGTDWTVTAALELQSKALGSLGTGATFKDNLARAGETVSFALPLSSSRTTTRSFNQSFSLDLRQLSVADCQQSHDRTPVVGTIGVAEMAAEFEQVNKNVVEQSKVHGVKLATNKLDKDALFSGRTVFEATLALTAAGPQWVLRHFTGGPIVGASASATGTLELAFIQKATPKAAAPIGRRDKKRPQTQVPTKVPENMIERGAEGFNLLQQNYHQDEPGL